MARHFGVLNKSDTKWLTNMADQVPACYDKASWTIYLKGVQMESQDDNALRMSLCRGQLPDYCEGCTEKYQRRMLKAGRCHPPAGAQSPLLPIELSGGDEQ